MLQTLAERLPRGEPEPALLACAWMTEPTGFARDRVGFKLAAFFSDVHAQDDQSVRSYATQCWPVVPTFWPHKRSRPDRRLRRSGL